MSGINATSSKLKPVAKAGFVAKGIVYCLLGVITFMAAFNINGQSTENTDKNGVFDFLYKQPGGQVLLGVLALGLFLLLYMALYRGFQEKQY